MAGNGRADGIDTGSDLHFEERWWRMEQVVWGAMTLVLIGALAGAFGRGWLSEATAGQRGGALSVDYERFARFRTPTVLDVHLGPAA
ncbi:MAG TPA: hypothetical protein VGD56_08990, partial [Gemmatirosa sp.]